MTRGKKYNDTYERHVLLAAARFDTFTLGQLWDKLRYVHYGYLSQLLLRWWREDGLLERLYKDGTWRPGNIYTKPDKGLKATYRWVDENEIVDAD